MAPRRGLNREKARGSVALPFTSPIPHYMLSRAFVGVFRAKVKESALVQEDKDAVAMLRLMLVTVVASYTIDDDLLSECQVCAYVCHLFFSLRQESYFFERVIF